MWFESAAITEAIQVTGSFTTIKKIADVTLKGFTEEHLLLCVKIYNYTWFIYILESCLFGVKPNYDKLLRAACENNYVMEIRDTTLFDYLFERALDRHENIYLLMDSDYKINLLKRFVERSDSEIILLDTHMVRTTLSGRAFQVFAYLTCCKKIKLTITIDMFWNHVLNLCSFTNKQTEIINNVLNPLMSIEKEKQRLINRQIIVAYIFPIMCVLASKGSIDLLKYFFGLIPPLRVEQKQELISIGCVSRKYEILDVFPEVEIPPELIQLKKDYIYSKEQFTLILSPKLLFLLQDDESSKAVDANSTKV